MQVIKEQESVLADRKQAADQAAAALEYKQQQLAAKEASLSDALTKLEHQQAVTSSASDELDRHRKGLEAARRGLAGIEGALEAREAQLAESWGQLSSAAAALKEGDLDNMAIRTTVCVWGGSGVMRFQHHMHPACSMSVLSLLSIICLLAWRVASVFDA